MSSTQKRNLKKKVLQLRAEGKTYKQIQQKLNCSKSTISYYCNKVYAENLLKTGEETLKERWLDSNIKEVQTT